MKCYQKNLPLLMLSFLAVFSFLTVTLNGATHADEFAFITTTDYTTGSSSVIWLDDIHSADKNVASIGSDAVSRYYRDLIYVVNRYGGDNIQVLDPSAGFATVRQYSVGNGSDPHDIAFISETKAYVTRYNRTDLWIVNPSTGAHSGTIDLSPLADGDGIPEMDCMILIGDRLFISIQRLDRDNWWLPAPPSYIAVVDVTADTLLDVDPATPGSQSIVLMGTDPYAGIHFNPWNGLLSVSCVGTWGVADDGIEVIDPMTCKSEGILLTESEAGGDISDFAIVTPGRGYAIIMNSSFHNELIVFNPQTGEKIGTLYAPGDFVLSDLEISPGKELFLCDRTATKPGIRIFDTYTDTEITTDPIDVGLPPFDICFSVPIQTGDETPPAVSLGQNYPNPFNPITTIPVTISHRAVVNLEIFDVSGRLVKTLFSEEIERGTYHIDWHGRDNAGHPVSSGFYFVRLQVGGFVQVRKVVLLR